MAVNASALCLTPECVQLASHILSNMAPNYQSVDPCVNFDQFACGGFPTQYPDKQQWGSIVEVQDQNKYILKGILDTDYPTTSESSPDGHAVFDMLQTNYLACMNTTNVEAEASSGLKGILGNIMSIFSVSDYTSNATMSLASDDNAALAKLQVYLNTLGINVITSYSTIQDPESPTTFAPLLEVSGNEELVSVLKQSTPAQLVQGLQKLLPNGTAQSTAQQLVESMGVFLEQIATLTGALPALSIESVERINASSLGALAPALAIDQVFEALVPSDYSLTQVGIMVPDFWTNISAIIEATPKATIQATYLLATAVSIASISEVSTTNTDRFSATCFTHLDTTMPWAAAKFWLDAVYDDKIGTAASSVIEDLRATFDSRLDDVAWMSNSTRALAKEKVEKIRKNIAYPTETPDAINATDVAAFYKGFVVGPSHLNNTLSWRQWDSARKWNLLTTPSFEWPADDHTYLVNAAYNPQDNSIYFPAGILRFPLFTPTLPSYIVYGAFGSVSGHELTHGFDNSGRLWNDVGALTPGQWDNATVAEFTQRTECFISQFSNISVYADYPVQGAYVVDPSTNGTLKVNGAQTLNENIADAGGVATSYAAWSARKDSEPEKNLLLPGLDDLTPEQLFFIAFGQFFCHRYLDDELIDQVATDVHSPNMARNMGIMENSRGFRDAFQCKQKEPVCEIW